MSDHVRSAMAATKGLLNAIGSPDCDLAEWEELRCRLLSSPERRAAVAAEKKRHGL